MKITLENKDKIRMTYWIDDEEFKKKTDVEALNKIYEATTEVYTIAGEDTVIYREI